jgi:uncharacterized protein (TIGR00369 family)
MTLEQQMARLQDARAAGNVQAIVDQIPFLSFLNVTARVDREGSVTCTLPFQERIIGNPTLPAIHGGVIGGLLESVALLQLIWSMNTHVVPRTINTSMDFLRSGQARETYARGRITRQGRRVANVRVEAWQDDPVRPIAAAHGHFLVG